MMESPGVETTRGGTGLKSDQVSGLILLGLALYIGWLNREFPVGTLAEPGPGYVPLLLAAGLGGIGLLVWPRKVMLMVGETKKQPVRA